VTFRYRQDPQGIRQYGLIAEEVVNVFPELVTRGSDGGSAQNRRLRATLVEQTAALDH
jgi:Chaperone of endosialidase